MYKDIRRNLLAMYVNGLDGQELSDLFQTMFNVSPEIYEDKSAVKRKIIRFLSNPSYATFSETFDDAAEPASEEAVEALGKAFRTLELVK